VKEQLRLLERLQEIDSQIDHHEKEMSRLPLEIQDIARSLVLLRREISESREKIASVEKEYRRKEQDLTTEQDKIKKSERRLLSIKNQKEYNALSREVKLGKKVAGEIEDAILTFMTEIENLKKVLERKEKEYHEAEQTLLEKKSRSETITEEAQKALGFLNTEKEEITVSLDRDFLKKYQVVKKARGNALAELQNGSCTGCHIAIPPQLHIRLLKQEEMITCPNCHRILYVKPENIPVLNKLDT
jgi:predicted  nucleic acid-binding Zn-ribbon protein